MQDHAKQGYIFGHLSLTRSLALDIPSVATTVKDCQKLGGCSQKIDLSTLREPLLLGK